MIQSRDVDGPPSLPIGARHPFRQTAILQQLSPTPTQINDAAPIRRKRYSNITVLDSPYRDDRPVLPPPHIASTLTNEQKQRLEFFRQARACRARRSRSFRQFKKGFGSD